MITLRPANMNDKVDILLLFNEYVKEAKESYAGKPFNTLKAFSGVMLLIKSNSCFLALRDNRIIGGIAGVIFPCLFTDDNMFSALFFYIKPDERSATGNFLKLLNKELSIRGITKLVLGVPVFNEPEKYERYYKINGFQLLETHFYKDVKNEAD